MIYVDVIVSGWDVGQVYFWALSACKQTDDRGSQQLQPSSVGPANASTSSCKLANENYVVASSTAAADTASAAAVRTRKRTWSTSLVRIFHAGVSVCVCVRPCAYVSVWEVPEMAV